MLLEKSGWATAANNFGGLALLHVGKRANLSGSKNGKSV